MPRNGRASHDELVLEQMKLCLDTGAAVCGALTKIPCSLLRVGEEETAGTLRRHPEITALTDLVIGQIV